MRFETKGIARLGTFACLAAVLLGASESAAGQNAAALAARTRRGVLVHQVGSDWCVSGENVRKAFESREFEKAVGEMYVLAVYDEMDSPPEAAKAKNELVKDILMLTKRFPALTCYAPGRPPRARYVRVRRKPEAKTEFSHLSKILVYGRKLYRRSSG